MELAECTRSLWGQSTTFRPALIAQIWGDGQQWVAFMPLMLRPLFYVVRLDGGMSLDNQGFDWNISEITDEIFDAIEDAYGPCCEDWENCDCDGFEVWPYVTPQTFQGCCWRAMDAQEVRELMP